MPNWYVIDEGNYDGAKVIRSTAGENLEFVSDFTEPKQWKRTTYDTYNPYTAEERYDLYGFDEYDEPLIPLIPLPVNISILPGNPVNLSVGSWVVTAYNTLRNEAQYLAGNIAFSVSLYAIL